MKFWKLGLTLIASILILTACGGTKYEAVPINEEVDVCVICNMQVKDDAYATQLTTKDGKNYKFDDIGCMNEWKEQNGTENIGMDFVRDYNDKEWIEFSKATYVYDESIRTPMAYGIVSFKDKESAEAFVSEQGVGTILTAEDLGSHTWDQGEGMMDMSGEGHGHSHSHDESEHSHEEESHNHEADTDEHSDHQ
ncbi:nitrous oxide reductase accessory protein NosL [Paenibacillus sp. PDC88]|uniref:nitrous oxide reductase accessory protein NosL n=1 Tax=Paenibacillus sp. PDC88 TaxID=1884375 RepID=UPI000894307F|nr:nitrous oxide reductase accessory protein NosL [Paenibacillus sp. PDC88]SDW74021.1 copper chaperone NosL [Paenibacillus sp. PDC88]